MVGYMFYAVVHTRKHCDVRGGKSCALKKEVHNMFRMKVAQGAVAIQDESIRVVSCIRCTKAHPHTSMVDGAFTHTMLTYFLLI